MYVRNLHPSYDYRLDIVMPAIELDFEVHTWIPLMNYFFALLSGVVSRRTLTVH